jgi:hypothetical protein
MAAKKIRVIFCLLNCQSQQKAAFNAFKFIVAFYRGALQERASGKSYKTVGQQGRYCRGKSLVGLLPGNKNDCLTFSLPPFF